MKHDASEDESEEENEEGDYTVYECPGLAPVSILTYILLFGTLLMLSGLICCLYIYQIL
jgi:hypothetical protein